MVNFYYLLHRAICEDFLMSTASAPWLDHAQLRQASRVAGSRALWIDLLLLVSCGIVATLMVALIDLDLKTPGHAILKGTFPIALGLALVPRRFSGFVISGTCIATLYALRSFPSLELPGGGATTSLILLGPMLDLFLWKAKPGINTYVRFGLAGLLTNALAFSVRWGGKSALIGPLGMIKLDKWLTIAPITYALCGIAAGIVSAAILFRAFNKPSTPAPTSQS